MTAGRHVVLCSLSFAALAGCAGSSASPRSTATLPDTADTASTPRWGNFAIAADGVDGSRPTLAFTADGHAIATLSGTVAGLTRVLRAAPDSTSFGDVGQGLMLAPPAPYGRGGVAYLRAPTPAKSAARSHLPIGSAPTTELGVSLGTSHGSLGGLLGLARWRGAPRDLQAALAGSPRGDLAVAWVQPQGGRRLLRLALLRPSGGGFAAPRTVATARRFAAITLAYGERGDLVLAFGRHAGSDGRIDIAARVTRAAGSSRPVQSLGTAARAISIATAMSPHGDAVVAWGTQDARDKTTPWTLRAAVLSANAPSFWRMQTLDRVKRVPYGVARVLAAIGGDGIATVVWGCPEIHDAEIHGSDVRPYPCRVRAASAGPMGSFGAPQRLARHGSALGLVGARDGTTTVLWGLFPEPEELDDYVESLDQMRTSQRPAGAARFASATALAPREATVNGGAIALDPRSHRPAALWLAAPAITAEEGLYDIYEFSARYVRGPR